MGRNRKRSITHGMIKTQCRNAMEEAKRNVEQQNPGMILRCSDWYVVGNNNSIPFGDYHWKDRAMQTLNYGLWTCVDKGATLVTIEGTIDVASEQHRFTINQHTPYAGRWSVTIYEK